LGFVSPQFDLIDNRFIAHRIKALDVICSEDAQGFESVTANGSVANALRDPYTGELIPNRALLAVVSDVVGSVGIGKVFDTYTVTVTVIDTTTNDPITGATQTVLVNDEVVCPAVRPGDVLQKHDIQPNATFALSTISPFDVTLSVWVTACVIVARETILKIRAGEPFCP